MNIAFHKVHGAGNDFVLLPDSTPDLDWPKIAQWACDRHTAVGADGVVGITRRSTTAFDVICHNADGSEASMCGNALRCAARCIHLRHGLDTVELRMGGRRHRATIDPDGRVSVTVRHGAAPAEPTRLHLDGREFLFRSIWTGTEHVVAVVADVNALDVPRIGPPVRHHAAWAPLGSNVDFAHPAGPNGVALRTYERGVEAETLSCGSGAVAAALVARHLGVVEGDLITVGNRGGHPLTVRLAAPGGEESWLTGPAEIVYSGEFPWTS